MSDIETLEAGILAEIEAAADEVTLETVRVSSLGKKGSISEQMKTLGKMSPEERQTMGPALNGLKVRITDAISARRDVVKRADIRPGSPQKLLMSPCPAVRTRWKLAASIRSVR